MKDNIDHLTSDLKDAVEDREMMNTIGKQKQLQAYIDIVQLSLEDLDVTYKEIVPHSAGVATKYDEQKSKIKDFFTKNILGTLSREAGTDVSSLIVTLSRYLVIYKDASEAVNAEFGKLFDKAEVGVLNLKVSHAIVLAILSEANIVSEFAGDVFNVITSVAAGETVPKYRLERLARNVSVFNKIVQYRPAGQGINLFEELKNLKSKGGDIQLVDDNMNVMTNMISSKTSSKFVGAFAYLNPLNIIRLIGETYQDIVHAKAQKRKEQREWLNARRTRLLSTLNSSDVDTDRVNKIISNYDAQITKIDRKIAKYENS